MSVLAPSMHVAVPMYELLWETIPELDAVISGESAIAGIPSPFGIPVHVNRYLPDGVLGMLNDGKGGFTLLVTERFERESLARRFAAKGWRVKVEWR